MCDTNELVCVLMTMEERFGKERHFFMTLPDGRDGRFSMRDQLDYEAAGRNRNTRSQQQAKHRYAARWPLRTVLTGVGEHQVQELRDFVRQRDLRGTTVHEDGSVEWSGPKARKAYCKAVGLFDRNAGYSDPMPDFA